MDPRLALFKQCAAVEDPVEAHCKNNLTYFQACTCHFFDIDFCFFSFGSLWFLIVLAVYKSIDIQL